LQENIFENRFVCFTHNNGPTLSRCNKCVELADRKPNLLRATRDYTAECSRLVYDEDRTSKRNQAALATLVGLTCTAAID